MHENISNIIKSLTILTTNKCNLNCVYCYANGGSYNIEENIADWSTVKNFLELCLKYFPNFNVIKLFGGEPLLNPEIVFKTVEYMKQKGKNPLIGLTTNGTILNNEIVQFFRKNNIALTISLDGKEIIHNSLRMDKNGIGSFSKVMETIEKLKENNINFAIEATYTGLHIKNDISIFELLQFLNGFTKSVKIQPVFSLGKKELEITNETIEKTVYNYVSSMIHFLSKEPLQFSNLLYENYLFKTFNHFLLKRDFSKKEYICSLPYNITLFPNGELYPCYLVMDKKFRYGTVYDFAISKFSEIHKSVKKYVNLNNLEKKLNKNLCYINYCGHLCAGDLNKDGTSLTKHVDNYFSTMVDSVAKSLSILYQQKEPFNIFKVNLLTMNNAFKKFLGVENE